MYLKKKAWINRLIEIAVLVRHSWEKPEVQDAVWIMKAKTELFRYSFIIQNPPTVHDQTWTCKRINVISSVRLTEN